MGLELLLVRSLAWDQWVTRTGTICPQQHSSQGHEGTVDILLGHSIYCILQSVFQQLQISGQVYISVYFFSLYLTNHKP